MQKARMIGSYVEQLAVNADVSVAEVGKLLGCDEYKAYSFIKGRAYVSFDQIKELASFFDVSVSSILAGDQSSYDESVVHCMNRFDDSKKREKILDLIDDYMDILDAVGSN